MQERIPRPDAIALSVEDLMGFVASGKVRVPDFQRLYRWEPSDVCALFDSLYRGFPVGTLLFWEREAKAERLAFESLTIEAPALSNAWWVVDGQQRITSLALALLAEGAVSEGNHGTRRYVFNLEEERFEVSRALVISAPRLPLSVAHDSRSLLPWLAKQGVDAASVEYGRALELNKIVRETKLTAYVLRGAEEKHVRGVFDRINNFGKRLDDTEVFHALHGSLPGSAPTDLGAVAASLGRIGFGTLDTKIILQCLVAVRGGDLTKMKDEVRKHDAFESLAATERALERTLSFLKRDAEVPHLLLLPYSAMPLVTLARFFHEFPDPKPRSRELLRRWLYRGAVSGEHGRNAAPKQRAALDAIDARNEEESVQGLLALVPRLFSTSGWLGAEWNPRSAITRLVLLAMASLGPRDPFTGATLDVGQLFEQHGSLAIGKIGRPYAANEDLFESASLRVLFPVTRPKETYDAIVRDEMIAASHGFTSPHAYASGRAGRLQDLTLSECLRRAGAEESDRPTIAHLLRAV